MTVMNNKLFVGNLDFSTSSADLEAVFGAHGQVLSAKVISHRDSGDSRGFGFVEYASSTSAESALSSLDGSELHGRVLAVSVARERSAGTRR